jgi:drug/metabolite transporter (DMT)-like permease
MSGGKRFLTRARQAELSLLAITMIWGLTFSMVKETLDSMPPFVFMSYRFALAFLVMLAVCGRRLRAMDRGTALAGLLLGVFLYAAYSFQTFGLQRTTAGNAGFITGLFVVFVPVLSTVILRKRPGLRAVLSVIVATVGLALLSLQPGLKVNSGDLLVLACAFTYSLHIIYMDRFVRRHDLFLLTLVQMGVVAVLQTASALIFEEFVLPGDAYAWATIVVCGIFASALAFFVQAWAQREISPVRTSVVLIMEPVFSVFFGIILLGETLTWRGWLGCALMLAGMLISEIAPERAAEESVPVLE